MVSSLWVVFSQVLFPGLVGTQQKGILILGLDGAGKTIILCKLQVGLVVTTIPTIGFHVATVIYKNLESQAWDQGGQTNIRPCCGIILQTQRHAFVVGSRVQDQIGIPKSELAAMVEEEELRKAILKMFANKQALEQAMTPSDRANAPGLPAPKDQKWLIFKI
ncbi:unnamed protein product [Gulo gulo]|uniref:Uncharacterized protein n=1 Tax=Gulo gulo TaxID=48420 RepID=A0A9X9LEI5_GULGU|nr:unnamed protein product [Gulo gulo]